MNFEPRLGIHPVVNILAVWEVNMNREEQGKQKSNNE